jgi:metallophosphoesterase (TIGR03767 family)
VSDDRLPINVSRRTVLRAGLLGAGASAATAGLDLFPSRRAFGAAAPNPAGTTLDEVLLPGPRINAGGYRLTVTKPGEPYLVRTELGAAAGAARAQKRRGLVAFAQLTDLHLIDAQSPGRVEYLDRFSDGKNAPVGLLLSSAWRPQETLTLQVLEAMVQAVNAHAKSTPVTQTPLAFAISTGDNVDNCQHNELRWGIDVLDGQQVRPDSGDLKRYEGVQDGFAPTYSAKYWHPAGTPSGKPEDQALRRYGFPRIPSLLDACRRPFQATGLAMPWLTMYGNHDGLIQGNIPSDIPTINTVATGSKKVVALPADFSSQDLVDLAALKRSTIKRILSDGPTRTVTADPNRRIVGLSDVVSEHFTTTGKPNGHGYTAANQAQSTAYYTFDSGPMTGIVLDTTNSNGQSDGSLDPTQFAWLNKALIANSRRYLADSGAFVPGGKRDQLLVVFSHHTMDTMTNVTTGPEAPGKRISGDEVVALLLKFPNVIMWVNGHTHVNAIQPVKRPLPTTAPGGFWEVNTASHVDWPQQARLIELADNRDGTLSIFGTIIDSAAKPSYGHRTDSPVQLASLSRELAANDWQDKFYVAALNTPPADGRRGRTEDRNVELLVTAPFALSGTPSSTSSASGSHIGRDVGIGAAAGAVLAGIGAAGAAIASRRGSTD